MKAHSGPSEPKAYPNALSTQRVAASNITGRPIRRAAAVITGDINRPMPLAEAMRPFAQPGAPSCLIAIVSRIDDCIVCSNPIGIERTRSTCCVRRAIGVGGRSLADIAVSVPAYRGTYANPVGHGRRPES